MLISFNGLVVREEKSDDYGKYITILSDTRGRVFMSAKGVGSVKNKNSAGCKMFTYGEFVAYYRDGRYTLKSAAPSHYCIPRDTTLEQLSLASYFADLADLFGKGESDTSELLRQCMNAIYILYKNDRPRRMLKAIYELRILCMSGYMPDVEECAACGEALSEDAEGYYFCYVDGVFVCKECPVDPTVKKIFVSSKCIGIMRYVISSPENKAYAIKIPEQTEKEFCIMCEEFLLAQLERKPESLGFYNTIEEDNGKF